MIQPISILFVIVLIQINIMVFNAQGTALTSSSAPVLPIGTVVLFSGDVIPKDWLLCDGSAVPRLTYFPLFLVIGTLYGTGDHIRTFNLPDFRGRFPLGLNGQMGQKSGVYQGGASEIKLTQSQLPSHTHDLGTLSTRPSGAHAHGVSDPGHNHGGQTGDNVAGPGGRGTVSGGGFHDYARHTHTIPWGLTNIQIQPAADHVHSIQGTLGNTGQGNPIPIMNPYQTMNYIIYAGPDFVFPTVG